MFAPFPEVSPKSSLLHRLIAILALTSQTLGFASPLATDPAVHAGKGKEAGALDATAEGKTRARLAVADRETGARNQGYQRGFRTRSDEIIRAAFERGRSEGDPVGANAGRTEGRTSGQTDGQNAGAVQGANEGLAEADRQAKLTGQANGSALGRNEAEATDAAAQGAQAGRVKGDEQAKASAEANEYNPARDAYRAERYAERVNSQTNLDLKKGFAPILERTDAPSTTRFTAHLPNVAEAAIQKFVEGPTVPNVQPTQGAEKAIAYCKTATQNEPTETNACLDVFVKAYNEAFLAAFPAQYLANYNEQWPREFDAGLREGITTANRDRNVSDRAEQSLSEGRARGYAEGYKPAFDTVYQRTYNLFYETGRKAAADAKYREMYATLEAGYTETARAAAFNSRKAELYSGAYESARVAEYHAKYPGYASQAKVRARVDEVKDFELRPVRLTSELQTLESIEDGILEPAENLSLAFMLRNFSAAPIEPKDLDLRATAVDANGLIVTEANAILTKALPAKGVTTVRGAFTIQLNDQALRQAKTFRITMNYRGRAFADSTLALRANTLTRIEFAEAPETHLGYPGVLKLRITNQSTKVLPEDSLLVLDTRVTGLTFDTIQVSVGKLAPGATTVAEFPFMNRGYGQTSPVSFVATLTSKTGRLTGVMNQSQALPVFKDYEVKVVKGDLDELAKKGREAVRIRVYNVSKNPSAASVTVESSIVPSGDAQFSFIKGAKVVYQKISPGNFGEQKITVKSEQKNGHGKFVMKVTVGEQFLGYFEETF